MDRGKKTRLFILLLVTSLHEIKSSHILFLFGGGNLSHKISIWPYVTSLAEAGHNVTFISSSDKVIGTHPRVKDVTPLPFREYTQDLYTNIDRVQARLDDENWDIISPTYHETSLSFCMVLFKMYKEDEEFRGLFQKSKTDLVVINAAFNDCTYYLIYEAGIKFIIFSSSHIFPWFYGAFGVPTEASVIPDMMANVGFPPTFFDRLHNLYRHYLGYTRASEFDQALQQLCAENFKTVSPPLSVLEIERNASLVFLNSHYSIDFARSFPPNFINIGGMQCWSEVGPLPIEFQDYMDQADDGVVLITFGSTIDFAKLDVKYTNIFLNMMHTFHKIRFIWKWDGPMPRNAPANLMASSWLPQRQILDHPKLLAFMTHGGLNSIIEATFHGVPIIVFPLFADQDFNAYRVKAQQVGVSVEFRTFSQESLDSAVSEVLTNEMYKKNMMTRSKIFKDRGRTPAEEAVFWTEFALRQDDTSALKPMLLGQSFYVRHSVDVLFGLFVVILILPLILLSVVTWAWAAKKFLFLEVEKLGKERKRKLKHKRK